MPLIRKKKLELESTSFGDCQTSDSKGSLDDTPTRVWVRSWATTIGCGFWTPQLPLHVPEALLSSYLETRCETGLLDDQKMSFVSSLRVRLHLVTRPRGRVQMGRVFRGGSCTDETSCLVGKRWGRSTEGRGLYGVSLLSSPDEPSGWLGIKRQWRSTACCAWVQRRRWEGAAGSRAEPGPKRRENEAQWQQIHVILVKMKVGFFTFKVSGFVHCIHIHVVLVWTQFNLNMSVYYWL